MHNDDYDLEDFICPECGHEGTHSARCFACWGDGHFDISDEDFLLPGTAHESCDECSGTGINRWCPECKADLSGRTDLEDPSEQFYN